MTQRSIQLLLAVAFALTSATAKAGGFWHDTSVRSRLGYNLGGTSPIGLPASIRRLNSFTLQPNPSIGIDATKPLADHWGITVGLRIENKGMKIDAKVKNYHEDIVRGGEELAGQFTGDVTTKVGQWMITMPIQATWLVSPRVQLRLGPYVSVLTDKTFTGYAHDGYLRVGDPTGSKVELGGDYSTRGNYDFSDDMRNLQWGVGAGIDWNVYRHLGVFAELNWGLNGIHHSHFKTIEQTLYPIFGTFGVTYRIR
jgi:hypothetical protein